MTLTDRRLTDLLATAEERPFDDNSRFIIFSDCHRGDNSWADDFAPNHNLLLHALTHYFEAGFTYIELGDGDEMWENHDFAEIRNAHQELFALMRQFFLDDRLIMFYGNHDLERQDELVVARTLFDYLDERTGQRKPLFPGIRLVEGLKLRHRALDLCFFLVHGHQGDLMNDILWRWSRFQVRHFWRHAQLLGVRNPTSPAKNFKKRTLVERRITEWIVAHDQPLICGHTHQSKLAPLGAPPYFNSGSCVHPRSITGIEIAGGGITLVRWAIAVRESGDLYVGRRSMYGPIPLQAYASQ